MWEADAPPQMAGLAYKHVAFIDSILPKRNLHWRSPYEIAVEECRVQWHHNLRQWGCKAERFLPNEGGNNKRGHKVLPASAEGMYVGNGNVAPFCREDWGPSHPISTAMKCYDRATGRLYSDNNLVCYEEPREGFPPLTEKELQLLHPSLVSSESDESEYKKTVQEALIAFRYAPDSRPTREKACECRAILVSHHQQLGCWHCRMPFPSGAASCVCGFGG